MLTYSQSYPIRQLGRRMPLEIRLSASLRRQVPGYDLLRGLAWAWEPGLNVAALLARLDLNPQDVKIIMINGRAGSPASPLADGDRVGLFPAMGGG
ncbi:MoaD/ThiS family protein [Desulfarculales bacterium]